jgi:hypothetical protein
MATTLTFQSEILINGINPYVLVSAQQGASLKPRWRRPMPVLVQVNGQPEQPWHINMMPMGNGDFYLYLHGDIRKASDTKVGDQVTVTLKFDSSYKNGPQHEIPAVLEKAIRTDETIKSNWHKLPPSRQKEVLRYIANLKSKEAKDRNLIRVLHVLSGATDHFMGRDWVDGK